MGRRHARENMRTGKGSSTKGILKGDNCKKSPLKVQLAKDTKMYKNNPRGHAQVSEIVKSLNKL